MNATDSLTAYEVPEVMAEPVSSHRHLLFRINSKVYVRLGTVKTPKH